jgi:hypothetical protein
LLPSSVRERPKDRTTSWDRTGGCCCCCSTPTTGHAIPHLSSTRRRDEVETVPSRGVSTTILRSRVESSRSVHRAECWVRRRRRRPRCRYSARTHAGDSNVARAAGQLAPRPFGHQRIRRSTEAPRRNCRSAAAVSFDADYCRCPPLLFMRCSRTGVSKEGPRRVVSPRWMDLPIHAAVLRIAFCRVITSPPPASSVPNGPDHVRRPLIP